MFLTIQNGDYTINTALISEIEWGKNSAEVRMITGREYTLEGTDYDRLILVLAEAA